MSIPNTDHVQSPFSLRQRTLTPLSLAGTFDERIAAMIGAGGLTNWYDFHPDRVIAGTDIEILNRVPGGVSLTEVPAFSGLVVSTANLPRGGQMIAHGKFNSGGTPNTVLTAGNTFPVTADAVWTKVVIWRDDESLFLTGPTRVLWRSQNGTNNNHNLQYDNNKCYQRNGTNDFTVDVYDYSAAGAFQYAIGSWNNTLQRARLSLNGSAYKQKIGWDDPGTVGVIEEIIQASGAVTQSGYYLGGSDASSSLSGDMGPNLLFRGITNEVGDLFDASRAADLANVKAYCEAQIGTLRLS